MIKRTILSFVFLLGLSSAYPSEIPPEIVNAFKSGNAGLLAQHFNNTVEFNMLDNENIYSKVQAEIILREFFKNNVPVDFSLLHQGGKESSKYAIGILTTQNNKKFRVTFLIKNIDNKSFIHQLRIEYENV